ncbi:MAG: hypothetical protein HFP81_01930 [Methylococcales symbiont of Hymedesmia sp. n. MRB-2018]|nr:MAG: hypothetical protein HFP78_03595 [Methylococcales symbiont of Hymedesmia sp. n. MRB-2018]KAF3984477.1 MAG: hypothetical protein HFP81_01930 [Methylococcales symbiont of Hymedesmia sp. n. MRB-2018]
MTSVPVKVTPEYEEAIIKLSDNHQNQRFLNDSIAHAELLATLMIGRAKINDDIIIYSGGLPPSCFSLGLNGTKSTNVRIVLDDKDAATKEEEKFKDNPGVQIKLKDPSKANEAHFFVAGESFRLEIDHGKAKAVANFNDHDAVSILKDRFELLWDASVNV